MWGADKSQTLADCIMVLGGGGGGVVRLGLGLCKLEGLRLEVSLEVSAWVCLRLLVSWALMASWYLRYLSCRVDILSAPELDSSTCAMFRECVDLAEGMFGSGANGRVLVGLELFRFKLPILSTNEKSGPPCFNIPFA